MKTLVVLVPLLSIACLGVSGSGKVTKETRRVSAFRAVEAGGALDLVIEQGDQHLVRVETDDNLLPLVKTEVAGDRLEVTFAEKIRPTKLRIHLTTPSLEAVELTGASRLHIKDVEGDRLRLTLSGASRAEVTGEVARLDIDASGAVQIDAAELEAEQVEVDGSGASKLDVYVSESLVASLSGAGKLTYRGDPEQVQSDLSGASTIRKR